MEDRSSGNSGQNGVTLVEVMVSAVILGLSIAATATMLGTGLNLEHKSNIELHVDLEENEIFPKLEELIDRGERRKLAGAFLAAKQSLEQRGEELQPLAAEHRPGV